MEGETSGHYLRILNVYSIFSIFPMAVDTRNKIISSYNMWTKTWIISLLIFLTNLIYTFTRVILYINNYSTVYCPYAWLRLIFYTQGMIQACNTCIYSETIETTFNFLYKSSNTMVVGRNGGSQRGNYKIFPTTKTPGFLMSLMVQFLAGMTMACWVLSPVLYENTNTLLTLYFLDHDDNMYWAEQWKLVMVLLEMFMLSFTTVHVFFGLHVYHLVLVVFGFPSGLHDMITVMQECTTYFEKRDAGDDDNTVPEVVQKFKQH